MSTHPLPKHSATEAQRHRILLALRAGPKSSMDLRKLGVYQHSVRIFELRQRGFHIETRFVSLFDHDGYEHRGCAMYELMGEPQKAETQ